MGDVLGLISTGIQILNFGHSLWGSYQSSKADKRYRAAMSKSALDEFNLLKQSYWKLKRLQETRRGMLSDRYGSIVSSLYDRLSQNILDINREYDRATGLSFSSGDYYRQQSLYGSKRAYQSGITSASFEQQSDLLNLMLEYEREMGQLKVAMASAAGEYLAYGGKGRNIQYVS